ncbi:hypothetical protein PoB_001540100, partial [Plakobranchus ocellatus]
MNRVGRVTQHLILSHQSPSRHSTQRELQQDLLVIGCLFLHSFYFSTCLRHSLSKMPPKRKSAPAENAAKTEDAASPAKQAKKTPSGKGRGRPPLSAEEKAKRAEAKANKPAGRGRGRPKGSTK